MNVFGEKIKKEREKIGLTLEELSEKTNLPVKTIEQIENGSLFPNVNHLFRISTALGKHEGHFLGPNLFKKLK